MGAVGRTSLSCCFITPLLLCVHSIIVNKKLQHAGKLVYCWSDSHTLLQDYSTEGMSESQLKFLQHLREFGLVFQRKVWCAQLIKYKTNCLIIFQRKSRRYYPTRLAINLASAGIGNIVLSNKSCTWTGKIVTLYSIISFHRHLLAITRLLVSIV